MANRTVLLWTLLSALLLGSCSAHAPQPLVLFAALRDEASLRECQEALVLELNRLGHEPRIEYHHCQGRADRAAELLTALDERGASVVVTFSTPLAQAACAIPMRSPVLVSYCFDAGRAGIEAHRERISGLSMAPDTHAAARWLIDSGARSVAVIHNPDEQGSAAQVASMHALLKESHVQLIPVTARDVDGLDAAMQAVLEARPDALWKLGDNTLAPRAETLVRTICAAGITVLGDHPRQLGFGARAVISIDFAAVGRASAAQLARLLDGARPASIEPETIRANRISR